MLHETLDKLSGFNVRFRLWALLSEVNPSHVNCREVTKSNIITDFFKIPRYGTVYQCFFLAVLLLPFLHSVVTLTLNYLLLTKRCIVHNHGKTKSCVKKGAVSQQAAVSVLSYWIRSPTEGPIFHLSTSMCKPRLVMVCWPVHAC